MAHCRKIIYFEFILADEFDAAFKKRLMTELVSTDGLVSIIEDRLMIPVYVEALGPLFYFIGPFRNSLDEWAVHRKSSDGAWIHILNIYHAEQVE